jgi:hypothetical protein
MKAESYRRRLRKGIATWQKRVPASDYSMGYASGYAAGLRRALSLFRKVPL